MLEISDASSACTESAKIRCNALSDGFSRFKARQWSLVQALVALFHVKNVTENLTLCHRLQNQQMVHDLQSYD